MKSMPEMTTAAIYPKKPSINQVIPIASVGIISTNKNIKNFQIFIFMLFPR